MFQFGKRRDEEAIYWQFLKAASLDISGLIQKHRDVLLNARAIDFIERVLNSNREKAGNEFERVQAKLQLLKNIQAYRFDNAWNQYMAFTERYAGNHSDEFGNKRRELFAQKLSKLGFTLHSIGGVEVILPPVCNVSAGEFLMGSDPRQDKEADADEQPQHRVMLPTYQIATFPVTVAEYGCFERVGGHGPQSEKGVGNWAMQLEQPDRSVFCVSWYDANAYTRWLTKLTGQLWRLPTEAEWEKAARWDQARRHSRIFPWGDHFEVGRCHSREDGIIGYTAVGSYPRGASPYGAQDMAGNVWEWTSSLLSKPYPYNQKDGREQADSAERRVLRGGSWADTQKFIRAAFRQGGSPGMVNAGNGFRLARAIPGS